MSDDSGLFLLLCNIICLFLAGAETEVVCTSGRLVGVGRELHVDHACLALATKRPFLRIVVQGDLKRADSIELQRRMKWAAWVHLLGRRKKFPAIWLWKSNRIASSEQCCVNCDNQ
jgi:hypothetical protein